MTYVSMLEELMRGWDAPIYAFFEPRPEIRIATRIFPVAAIRGRGAR